MMKQVRKMMEENLILSGPVEIDEAQFGGSDENKPKHLRGSRKALAMGIVERGGRVVTRVVPDAMKGTLMAVVKEVMPPKSMIYTDEHGSYDGLRWMGQSYKHKTVNHSKTYVDGNAHTGTIDGFWSLVKRGIKGVYYQVGAEYLQSYLNEYSFRYNRRKVMRPMFSLLAERTTIQVCPCARETKLLAPPE